MYLRVSETCRNTGLGWTEPDSNSAQRIVQHEGSDAYAVAVNSARLRIACNASHPLIAEVRLRLIEPILRIEPIGRVLRLRNHQSQISCPPGFSADCR